MTKPIPSPDNPDAADLVEYPIKENGESLVCASLAPDKVLARPRYFLENLPGSIGDCFVRATVWENLLRAVDSLPAGYRLVLFDAWRSNHLQRWLYERCVDEFAALDAAGSGKRAASFVASPMEDTNSPPPHLTGGAVDLSIVDPSGRLIDMGTDFDSTVSASATRYFETSTANDEAATAVRDNRRLLYHTMAEAGFVNLPTEWWHYSFGDQFWAWQLGYKHACYGPTAPTMRWNPLE